jgi:hypothetical protein
MDVKLEPRVGIARFRFYIDANAWWIDFPEWIEAGGPQEALQMVLGADVMLGWMSDGHSEVTLDLSDKPFKDARRLYRLDHACDSGSFYLFPATDYIKDHWRIWLCDVTKYIFTGFPDVIYFKIVENGKDNQSSVSAIGNTNAGTKVRKAGKRNARPKQLGNVGGKSTERGRRDTKKRTVLHKEKRNNKRSRTKVGKK